MQIDPSKPISAVDGPARQTAAKVPPRPTDSVSLARSEKLQEAYDKIPDVRAEKLARGKEIMSDTTYPPPEALMRLSRLLAIEFAPPAAE